MLRIALTPVLFAILLRICVFGQETSHKVPVAPALSSFPDRKLMQEIMDAWATLNPHSAARYYDQSPEDVFFDDAGGVKFVGWQAYEIGLRKVMASVQQAKWTVNNDAVVHPLEDMLGELRRCMPNTWPRTAVGKLWRSDGRSSGLSGTESGW
jgi:hypothetical protein